MCCCVVVESCWLVADLLGGLAGRTCWTWELLDLGVAGLGLAWTCRGWEGGRGLAGGLAGGNATVNQVSFSMWIGNGQANLHYTL